MEETWSLQEEIGILAARWYLWVLGFLVGGALGWGAAYVFPAGYEARAPLFVAFNTEALLTSPDDYKNAQFETATELMLSNAVLEAVLAAWDEGERETLRDQLSVEWRNAGRWDLVVRDQNPAWTARVAALWREITFDQLSAALSHALTFYHLDLEVNLLARQLAETAQSQTRLAAVEAEVRAWMAQPDEMSPETRAALWAYATEFATPRGFPEEGAARQAYQAWATELLSVLEVKRKLLDAEMFALQTRMETRQTEWEAEKTAARGLSAYLVVELRGEVETTAVRTPGLMALVGGGVGVLSLLVGWLVRLSRKGQKND
ncbi:MAG: hypothetical protein Fur0022_14820 [Anaerolineales bacterium]